MLVEITKNLRLKNGAGRAGWGGPNERGSPRPRPRARPAPCGGAPTGRGHPLRPLPRPQAGKIGILVLIFRLPIRASRLELTRPSYCRVVRVLQARSASRRAMPRSRAASRPRRLPLDVAAPRRGSG